MTKDAIAKMQEQGSGIRRAAGLDDSWTAERIETIRRFSTDGNVSNSDLAAFLAICNKYDLDPMAREAWLIKTGGRMQVTASRDGLVKIARRQANYQGHDSDLVHEKDEFRIVKHGGKTVVEHSYGLDRGRLVAAYCVIHTDTGSTVTVVKWSDMAHLHNKQIWKQYPGTMLESRAISHAVKKTFGLGGVYVEGEMIPDDEGTGRRNPAVAAQSASEATLEKLKAQAIGTPVERQAHEQEAKIAEPHESQIKDAEVVDDEPHEDEGNKDFVLRRESEAGVTNGDEVRAFVYEDGMNRHTWAEIAKNIDDWLVTCNSHQSSEGDVPPPVDEDFF